MLALNRIKNKFPHIYLYIFLQQPMLLFPACFCCTSHIDIGKKSIFELLLELEYMGIIKIRKKKVNLFFTLCCSMLSDKDGKAFHPTYEEKLRLVALHKQVLLGPYNPDASPEVGFFDVLGNDRR